MIKHQWLTYILITLIGLSFEACKNNSMPDDTIAVNDRFKLVGDSLIMGDTIVYSPDGQTIATNMKGDDGKEMQQYYAPNTTLPAGVVTTGHKLIDALSNMSISFVNKRQFMNFDTSTDMFDAIGMTLSYIDPELSMELLKNNVTDSVVAGKNNDYYPAYNNRMAWTTAAWRVYLATGDKEWLKYAYNISRKTFEQEKEIAFYKRDWLVRGCATDITPLVDALPRWMSMSDVFSTFTLSNNVEMLKALESLGEMAEELGQDGSQYTHLSHELKEAVNENMWNEKHGQYTAFIYGQSCTLHAPCSDNRAQALAVMWGIADEDDRSTTLMSKSAITDCGVNNFYPSRKPSNEPCINEASWGLTQGMWNMAAAHVDNDNSLRRGMAALWRAQALYSTLFINEGNANMDICCAISNIAMTHRLLAGMNFTADGIEFAPKVPICFAKDKHIKGFHYRDGILNITIKGTGRDIERIDLDNNRINGNFISAKDLEGEHKIVITMKEGAEASQEVNIQKPLSLPEEPVVMYNGDSAQIFNYKASQDYKLFIDGNLAYSVSDSVFAMPNLDEFSEVCLVTVDNKCNSYTSRPFITNGKKYQCYMIPEENGTKDSFSVNINVPESGDYMISLSFLSPVTTCDARVVTANNHKQGVTLLSGLQADGVAGQSNLIHVDLLRDNNSIIISGLPSCHGQARPVSLNLFKR